MKKRSIFNVRIFNAAVPLQGAFSSLFDTVFSFCCKKETEQLVTVIFVTICTNKNGVNSLVNSRATARRQTKERLKRTK